MLSISPGLIPSRQSRTTYPNTVYIDDAVYEPIQLAMDLTHINPTRLPELTCQPVPSAAIVDLNINTNIGGATSTVSAGVVDSLYGDLCMSGGKVSMNNGLGEHANKLMGHTSSVCDDLGELVSNLVHGTINEK